MGEWEALHEKNLENILTALYRDMESVWGNTSVYVHDMDVVDKRERKVYGKEKNNLWLRVSVITGDYKTGNHLVNVEIEKPENVTVEEYVYVIFAVLNRSSKDSGFFYGYEEGQVGVIEQYVGRSVMTFSASAFAYHMSVRRELSGVLKRVPVINDTFNVLDMPYVKEKISRGKGKEVKEMKIGTEEYNILAVEEDGELYIFGMVNVEVRKGNEGTKQNIILPYVSKKHSIERRKNYERLQAV